MYPNFIQIISTDFNLVLIIQNSQKRKTLIISYALIIYVRKLLTIKSVWLRGCDMTVFEI